MEISVKQLKDILFCLHLVTCSIHSTKLTSVTTTNNWDVKSSFVSKKTSYLETRTSNSCSTVRHTYSIQQPSFITHGSTGYLALNYTPERTSLRFSSSQKSSSAIFSSQIMNRSLVIKHTMFSSLAINTSPTTTDFSSKRASVIVVAGILPGMILIFVICLTIPKCCESTQKRRAEKKRLNQTSSTHKEARMHQFKSADVLVNVNTADGDG